MPVGVSVVIPSWNGLDLLRECLPSVLEAARHYSRLRREPTEILVVDDGSTDATAREIPREFPQVRLLRTPHNQGFAKACNLGFRQAGYSLVALLNNDVRVEPDYLLHQAPHFEDPQVFAVTAKVYDWERPLLTAAGRVGRFRRGFWSVYFNYDLAENACDSWVEERRLISAYAVGGFATYQVDKLRQLEGFCELLSPFHWEDIDLCYRAWKRGWEVRYEPRSIAHHRISATINTHFPPRTVRTAALRNRLLFHWINLHSPSFLLQHLFMLAVLVLTRWLVLDGAFYLALRGALKALPEVRRLRRRERRRASRSDQDLALAWRRFYGEAPIRIYHSRREIEDSHPDLRRRRP